MIAGNPPSRVSKKKGRERAQELRRLGRVPLQLQHMRLDSGRLGNKADLIRTRLERRWCCELCTAHSDGLGDCVDSLERAEAHAWDDECRELEKAGAMAVRKARFYPATPALSTQPSSGLLARMLAAGAFGNATVLGEKHRSESVNAPE